MGKQNVKQQFYIDDIDRDFDKTEEQLYRDDVIVFLTKRYSSQGFNKTATINKTVSVIVKYISLGTSYEDMFDILYENRFEGYYPGINEVEKSFDCTSKKLKLYQFCRKIRKK